MKLNDLDLPIDLGFQYIPELRGEINRHLKIYDLTRSAYVDFDLYEPQKRLLDNYEAFNFNVVRKSRQVGCTSATCAWISKKMIESREIVVIATNSLHNAYDISDSVKNFIRQWDENIAFTANSRKRFTLRNGSMLTCGTNIFDFISHSPTIIHIDEAANFTNVDIMNQFTPSLEPNGKIIIASTPNGFDDLFEPLYRGAPENNYHRTDMLWNEIPRFNSNRWLESMQKIYNHNELKIRQEIYAEFVS